MISPNISRISFLFLSLLFLQTNAQLSQSSRQNRVDQCANPNGNSCSFLTCENGGICFEDPTTIDCIRCQCPSGFTGKVCDTPLIITPTACNPTCINGGTCMNNVCVCPLGYSDNYCQRRDFCLPSNPCRNGGRCISTPTSFVCDCTSTGYTGTTCAEPTVADLCASRPCQNNGECSQIGGSVNCICFNGYSGSACQIPPVPCASAPCENGGLCQLTAQNVYGCVCSYPFTGTRCETSILANHPCVTNAATVCQNGGTCTVNLADYTCRCAPGWSGRNCLTRDVVSTCSPSPCGVHGTCLEGVVGTTAVAFCNCADRWTGKFCDVNMDVNCPVGYCLSGGTCRLSGSSPVCDCPVGYTGQRCETTVPVVNQCQPSPCLNGGTCLIGSSGFMCLCPPKFTGRTCDTFTELATPPPTTTTTPSPTTTTTPVIDMCSSRPCMNGGSCYGNTNIFVCQCSPQWTGTNCATPITALTTTTTTTTPPTTTTVTTPLTSCSANACKNGGTCYLTGDGPTCVCPWPWDGVRCETNVNGGVVTTTTVAPGVNPCISHVCYYGGTCVALGTTAMCNCVPPYTGRNCESSVSTINPMTTTPTIALSCAQQPCRNGGTCVPRDSSYWCFCGTSSAYTGKNCDTTTPMPKDQCPLECAPGKCVFSGNAQKPYACLWNGLLRPIGGTTA